MQLLPPEERERLADWEAEKLPTCDEYVDRFLALATAEALDG